MRTVILGLVGFTLCFIGMNLPMSTSQAGEAEKRFMSRVDGVAEDVELSCKAELDKYCAQVTPGEGRLLHCALAHEDKLSNDCAGAIFDAVTEMGEVLTNFQLAAEDCKGDIKTTCGKVESGRGRIAQCLIDNKSTISAACREAVDEFNRNN